MARFHIIPTLPPGRRAGSQKQLTRRCLAISPEAKFVLRFNGFLALFLLQFGCWSDFDYLFSILVDIHRLTAKPLDPVAKIGAATAPFVRIDYVTGCGLLVAARNRLGCQIGFGGLFHTWLKHVFLQFGGKCQGCRLPLLAGVFVARLSCGRDFGGNYFRLDFLAPINGDFNYSRAHRGGIALKLTPAAIQAGPSRSPLAMMAVSLAAPWATKKSFTR